MDGLTDQPFSPGDLLKATSRSFYLTLRVLPRRIAPQIGLAYLLARTADTIADTEILPWEQRLHALRRLRARILGLGVDGLGLGPIAERQGLPAERRLLENVEPALAALQALPRPDLLLVRDVLETITGGQELDLQRFHAAGPGRVAALGTAAELDDYTWRVAGCVGQFWTRLCRRHLFPEAALDDAAFLADGIRLGKGLQLVNILRDIPEDLAKGRCYLPAEQLAPLGLEPATLLLPENEPGFLALYQRHLDQAAAHLDAGWAYTDRIPRSQFRLRLACAWPVLIGVRTLGKLRSARVADLRRRVKVSRAEVRGILFRSLAAVAVPPLWRRLHAPPGKAVASGGKLA